MPRRIESNPDNFTLEIFIGAACSQSFQLTDETNTPTDITGYTFTLILKDVFDETFRLESGDAPTTLGSSLSITDAEDGKFTFTITDEETENAKEGPGRWALQVDEGDGNPYIMWRDQVEVREI